METPAEEIDSLLDEIPRATSAPPHFKNFSQVFPASYLPEVLFERKLPLSLSDSHVMSLAENPNPNPTVSRSPSSDDGPGITPRIPQASSKQQHFAACQEGLVLGAGEPTFGNVLAGLSLQDKETNCLRMLLDDRNKAYNPNMLMQDCSAFSTSSAPYVNPLPQLSRMPVPSLTKSLSDPASHSSMLLPFDDANILEQPHPQEGQTNLRSFPESSGSQDSEIFCMRRTFLGGEQPSSLGTKNIMMTEGFGQHSAKQLAGQQGYGWNSAPQNGSYVTPLVEQYNPATLTFSVSKQAASQDVDSQDLYENRLTTTSEFTPDGDAMALIWQQKLQFDRLTLEEKLSMQQLQSGGLNSTLEANLRYVQAAAQQLNYMKELENLQYISGFISPAHENVSSRNDANHQFSAQGHWIHGRNCPSSHRASYRESAPLLLSSEESFERACLYERLGALAASQGFQQRHSETNGNPSELTVLSAARRRKEKAGLLAGDNLLLLEERARVRTSLDETPESLQEVLKLTSLEDLEGKIFSVAKDQHGCRFLQRMLDEAKLEDVEMIFREIKEHVVNLMTDPFGNYLVQKLLDSCNESHHTAILEAVTKNDDLIEISRNMHGTRAVQKLIETLHTPDQITILTSCLKRGVVTLIKDLNGNHVVQRCLQRLENNNNQFIFDAAASHCMEIASHKHGCCVLQRCMDFASNVQKSQLVAEIAANALALSQDQYGNYVVQYILDLGLPWALVVVSRLEGSFPDLAMQKFSSNVVEKCLKVATEESKSVIIKELVSSSFLSQLCQDPFANYVVQSALLVSKGHLHASIIDAIKPLVHELRNSPYGKRILSRMQFKK